MTSTTDPIILHRATYTQAYTMQYGGLSNVSKTNVNTKNPLALFNTKHCLSYNGEQPTPLIAYSGDAKYTGPLVKDLQKMCKYYNRFIACVPEREIHSKFSWSFAYFLK